MKYLIIFIVSINNCAAQLVKTVNDAKKIVQNKSLFINKPLKILLQQIQPPIKMAYGEPSVNIQSKVGFFLFRFVDTKQNDSLRSIGKTPVTIIVYVKEYFDWNFQQRFAGNQLGWTNNDVLKYGNLTMIAFRVYGDN